MSRGGLALVLALQAALVARLVSPADVMSRPFGMVDYPVHFLEALNVRVHLERAGALWGWSPEWMAGFPEGILGLVDNKLFFAVLALAPSGWEPAAFNLGVLLALFVTPLAAYAAARRAEAAAAEAAGAAFAAAVATFAVPICDAFWRGGVISFLFASALAPWPLVGLAVALDRGTLFRASGLTALLAGAFATFVHPGAAVVMAPALAVVALTSNRRARAIAELVSVGLVLFVPMIPVFLAYPHIASAFLPPQPSSFPSGGLARLVDDWLWSLGGPQPEWGGAGALFGLVVLAAIGLRGSASRAATRALVVAASVSFVLAYAGSWLGPVKYLQPYRFLVPFAFVLAVPAGRGLLRLADGVRARRAPALVFAAIAALAIAKSAIFVIPPSSLGSGVDPTADGLARWIARETAADDRILVQPVWRPVPPFEGSARRIWIYRFRLLGLDAPREYLGHGGFAPATTYSYIQFGTSTLFRVPLSWFNTEARLRAALDRYGVSWVVVVSKATLERFRAFPGVLEVATTIGDAVVFRVREPQRSRVAVGAGNARAEHDRIEVHDAVGERLVLRYHWLPTFRTIPPLRIEEEKLAGASVGFIAVYPEGQRDFVIVNGNGP